VKLLLLSDIESAFEDLNTPDEDFDKNNNCPDE
jgi:hypothetical protein